MLASLSNLADVSTGGVLDLNPGATMPGERGSDTAQSLGAYLKSLRTGTGMTLRDIEEATERAVSNAYLSQLENGKISKPSPNVLHALAAVYGVSYGKLMERAGYVSPVADREQGARHGQAATYAVENLTREEEKALLDYLAFYRTQRDKP